ncbi:MAG: hypothetical protein K8R91_03610 [Phycisphaerae bacterium]|nr:hypothetical protein [Phycisphaerae bacterium]
MHGDKGDMKKVDSFRRQQRTAPRAHTARRVDVHCHCLPGLDDGPGTMAEAMGLCREIIADGITDVVATPHQLGRYDGRNISVDIRKAVSNLRKAVVTGGLPLRIWPGADVRIDERIPDMLRKDKVMTVADGGKYLLLELPHEAWISPIGLARELTSMGIMAILTHPERCEWLCRNPDIVFEWLENGICLQLTAGSIVGEFGSSSEKACWYWLGEGAVSLVATDAHGSPKRSPRMSRAFAAISHRLGQTMACRVCIEGPQRVLCGQEIAPVSTTPPAEALAWK